MMKIGEEMAAHSNSPDCSTIPTTTLLRAKTIDAAVLTESIRWASGKPTWGLARVIAMAREVRLVPPLLQWLKLIPNEDSPPLLWALGELNDVVVVPILLEALDDGTSVSKVYAAYALGRIGDRSAVGETLKNACRQVLYGL